MCAAASDGIALNRHDLQKQFQREPDVPLLQPPLHLALQDIRRLNQIIVLLSHNLSIPHRRRECKFAQFWASVLRPALALDNAENMVYNVGAKRNEERGQRK